MIVTMYNNINQHNMDEENKPLRILFSDTSETKTTMFFCYLNFEDIFFQMMYYDQEGDNTTKIQSDLADKDDEFQERFYEWFTVQLTQQGIPPFFIDLLKETIQDEM